MFPEERWKQRFENFEKAYLLLEEIAVKPLNELNDLEQQGAVQRFELVLALSCKIMSDYLRSEGVPFDDTNKEIIRQAFKSGLIEDGEAWMVAIDKRNKTSHTYDGKVLKEIMDFVGEKFYPLARDLYIKFKAKS